jgi:murein endopeptidase
VNNCNVVITHQARAFSGGHDHNNLTRPKGTFQPSSGSTGTSGFAYTYTSPEPSGIIDVTLAGTSPDGTPVLPGTFTIGVQIGGLAALGPGTNYQFTGFTSFHSDNHYGTPSLNGTLVSLADSYAAAFPNQLLGFNDMSLVSGGLFDHQSPGPEWSKPHASHRFGVDADMNLVPVAERRRMRQLVTAAGLRIVVEPGALTHWHLRQ